MADREGLLPAFISLSRHASFPQVIGHSRMSGEQIGSSPTPDKASYRSVDTTRPESATFTAVCWSMSEITDRMTPGESDVRRNREGGGPRQGAPGTALGEIL